MQLLDRPAFRNKTGGQIIQQFRMARTVALQPKVARRPDQTLAEMMLPNAIHDYPCRQRILRRSNMLGQLQPRLVASQTFADVHFRDSESAGSVAGAGSPGLSLTVRAAAGLRCSFHLGASSIVCRNAYCGGSSFFASATSARNAFKVLFELPREGNRSILPSG